MQNYTDILGTDIIRDSRALLMDNDKTIMSGHSGTAFPTTNLQVGMRCVRTDQNKEYVLKSTGPDVWVVTADLSAGVDSVLGAKADLVGGKVPADQLPSYVDDVVEYADQASFPAVGESGKLYFDLATSSLFRWTGSVYTEVVSGSGYVLPKATTSVLGGVKVDGTTITVDGNGVISGSNSYILPQATTTTLGGVKVDGTTITVDGNGVISGSSSYTLPKATTVVLGGVKVDGTTITVDGNGVITGTSPYTLPQATTTTLGGVKVDGTTITVDGNGVITGTSPYTLPKATTSVLGGVKADGTTITVDGNGVISGATQYTLPTASFSTLGGVKVGSTLSVTNGVIDSKVPCSVITSILDAWSTGTSFDPFSSGSNVRIAYSDYYGKYFSAVYFSSIFTLRSSADGDTWSTVTGSPVITSATSYRLFCAGSAVFLYVEVSGNLHLWVSTNGTSFTDVSASLRSTFGTATRINGICRTSSEWLMSVNGTSGTTGAILSSSDGSTWAVKAATVGGNTHLYGCIVYTGSNVVVTTTTNIYYSTNGGTTWSSAASTMSINIQSLAADTSGKVVALGAGGSVQIYYSVNHGISFTAATTVISSTFNSVFGDAYFIPGSSTVVVYAKGATYNAVCHSTDGGNNWVSPTSYTTLAATNGVLGVASSKIVAANSASGAPLYQAPSSNAYPTQLATGASAPGLLGSTSPTVAAAGSTQGTATVLMSDINIVTSGSGGVVVPGATSGKYAVVVNKTSAPIKVYPSTGHAFDGLSANTEISLPANGFLEMFGSSSTQWHTTLQAIVQANFVKVPQGALATAIDLAVYNNGVLTKTISGATTFTISNVPPAGTVGVFILDLTNGGSAAITWWATIKWAGGVAPTLTTAGRDTLGFMTYDGGTTWTGYVLGKDEK